jgi:TolB-like protein/Tfp pilus assembly protein PilF
MLIGAAGFAFVIAVVALAAFYFGSSGRTRINSVAVLPFANSSGDPNTEYLSDGITEGVIDRLSGLPNLKVISRTSAFHYKQRDIEPQKVAKDLGVDALVTGRVAQRGDDLSVSAELVDAREDKQVWGEQYNRKLADSASVQQEIAIAISGNLRARLTSEDKARLAKSAINPEAYQLYLKGRYLANQPTAENLKKSMEYFQQALDKDPGYAMAYVGLADSNNMLGGGLNYQSPSDTLPKAKAAARKALELDEMLGEAHAALAYAEWFYDWDWPNAEREFKRAIELNSNSAITHQRYAECLLTRSRFDETISELKQAQNLDPLSPTADNLGHVYWTMRRYDEAISRYQKTLDLYPNDSWLRAQLAWTYALKRMYPQALAEYEKIPDQDKAVAADTQLVADGLGWVYAVSGRQTDALNIVRRFNELSSHVYVDFYQLATIYAGLGEKDEAFRMLEKGYEQHSASMPYLMVDPFWDGMRSDPRFADLLRRMGLSQ